jgi:hypothetical protein
MHKPLWRLVLDNEAQSQDPRVRKFKNSVRRKKFSNDLWITKTAKVGKKKRLGIVHCYFPFITCSPYQYRRWIVGLACLAVCSQEASER